MKRPLRVLIVEDDVEDVDLLLRALRKGGYDPLARRVDTPEEMAAALAESVWDIVFSDWSMPRFSALGALQTVRAAGSDLPFIIISGTVSEEIAVEALKAGAHDFLSKNKLARLIPSVERELREAKVRGEHGKMQEHLMISYRMASVGIVAAGVAHEINNPLAAVMANLEIAVQQVESAFTSGAAIRPTRDLLDELLDAQESARRIRDIIRDVKLFSRADDDEAATCDLTRVLDSSLRMAWNQIRHRARLVKDYAAIPAVKGNESRLGQVFLNLIVNAAQAIPEGTADNNEIRVSTALDPDGRVVVEIEDTGPGMSPEVLKRLFTPFFTTKPIGVGTGLGLSICHRLVTSLGGEITVHSVVGQGSTFRIHLPAAQHAPQIATRQVTTAPVATHRGRILVVDDDPAVASALARSLEKDHDVTIATLAVDALTMIARGERFDVILCDLMMPQMTGTDLYEELRRVAPHQADKMVFLTGGALTSSTRAFLSKVSNARVEKPFNVVALRALVGAAVEGDTSSPRA